MKKHHVTKNPEKFHDQRYFIDFVATNVVNDDGVTHRLIAFTVYEGAYNNPELQLLGMSSGGKWRVVREREVVANVDFEKFTNRIRELVFETLNGDVTLEIKYEDQRIQVSKDYLIRNRFGKDNKAWMMLREYYLYGKPKTREQISKDSNVDFRHKSDFDEHAYKDSEHIRLDDVTDSFSPEELAAAERSVQMLEEALHKAGLKIEDLNT